MVGGGEYNVKFPIVLKYKANRMKLLFGYLVPKHGKSHQM